MKKFPRPIYSPPVPSLADYYHPPKESKKKHSKKNIAENISDQTASYAPPVPSLADYYNEPSAMTKSQIISSTKSRAVAKSKRNSKDKKSKKKK